MNTFLIFAVLVAGAMAATTSDDRGKRGLLLGGPGAYAPAYLGAPGLLAARGLVAPGLIAPGVVPPGVVAPGVVAPGVVTPDLLAARDLAAARDFAAARDLAAARDIVAARNILAARNLLASGLVSNSFLGSPFLDSGLVGQSLI